MSTRSSDGKDMPRPSSSSQAFTPRTAQAHLSLSMAAKLKTVAHRKAEAIRTRHKYYQNVKEEEKSLGTLITHSYTMPTFSTLPVIMLLAVYLNVFYESLGCNLAYLSFFIALARGLDVVSDPLMSYISDSSRINKNFWMSGRRRPFMLIGTRAEINIIEAGNTLTLKLTLVSMIPYMLAP